MGAVRIYAAVSLDGFVADADGDTAWLQPFEETIYQESGFMNEIGAVILGRRAYEFLNAFGEWPYEGKSSFVLSSKPNGKAPQGCQFISDGFTSAIAAARQASNGSDVWIVGGATTLQTALREGVVDHLDMCVVPVLIGQGHALLGSLAQPLQLNFDGIKTYPQDIIRLRYQTRAEG